MYARAENLAKSELSNLPINSFFPWLDPLFPLHIAPFNTPLTMTINSVKKSNKKKDSIP